LFDDLVADVAKDRNDPDLFSEATGRVTKTTEYLDEYLAAQDNTPKTKNMKRSDILRFSKAFPFFERVTNKKAKDWVRSLGVAPPTQKRVIGFISDYWRWCIEHKDLTAEYCLKDVTETLRTGKKTTGPSRIHYSDEDYQRLLDSSQSDPLLNDLIRLGAHTGCRIEELCSLKLANVTAESLNIVDAKTEAGIREIPIHKDIRQLVARLRDTSTDEYLISGLTFNMYDDRSNAIGKRFGRLKRKLGFGRQHVFHSFRNTLARKLEEEGVPENIAARTVGHKLKTMTYGLYSGGVSLKVKQEAIDKVSYKKQPPHPHEM
jgi:integrase